MIKSYADELFRIAIEYSMDRQDEELLAHELINLGNRIGRACEESVIYAGKFTINEE